MSAPAVQIEQNHLIVSAPNTLHARATEEFSASGAIVIDVASGQELFAHAANKKRPMGSLAKLMTAIVIAENHDLDEVVHVPVSAQWVQGNVVRLNPGERYTIHDLLAATLIGSANDAAYTLALYHSGDIESFAEVMNSRARALGLTQTSFQNPMGFDHPNQFSTPRELAWLSLYALKNDVIRSLTSLPRKTIQDRSLEHSITLYNTNQLLSSEPNTFSGLKTGTTDAAGQCLISVAEVEGRDLLFVILKSSDRYRDTLELYSSLVAKNI